MKIKYDDICLDLRHTEEKVREGKAMNDDLNLRFKVNTDELKGEMDRNRTDNDKKRDQIDQLVVDNKTLDETLGCVSSECKVLESDLTILRKKHEYSVNDLSNAIRRLEQENYNLMKIKEDLEKKHQEKQNENRNLNFDLK